jgi:hypothetical protein
MSNSMWHDNSPVKYTELCHNSCDMISVNRPVIKYKKMPKSMWRDTNAGPVKHKE